MGLAWLVRGERELTGPEWLVHTVQWCALHTVVPSLGGSTTRALHCPTPCSVKSGVFCDNKGLVLLGLGVVVCSMYYCIVSV